MTNQNIVSTLQPRSWRSEEMHNQYETGRQPDLAEDAPCPLCEAETIDEFEYWRIIENKYPYDAVAQKHDLLLPKEHLQNEEISPEAWRELDALKTGVMNERYAFIIEALPSAKSIPGHFHLHLLVPKKV